MKINYKENAQIVVLVIVGYLVIRLFVRDLFGLNNSNQAPASSPQAIASVIPAATPTLPSPSPSIKPSITTQMQNAPKPSVRTANPDTTTTSITISQKSAVNKAKSYLATSAFSRDGLVDQLEYEQYSHIDAVYGVDNSGANWMDQAAKKARQYMDTSAFSRGGLIDQLKYEKFTQEQAEYGANAVGL